MRRTPPRPLHSRLLAHRYAIATLVLVAFCSLFPQRCFADTAELRHVEVPLISENVQHGEQSASMPLDGSVAGVWEKERESEGHAQEQSYVGEFAYFEPSLIGRAPDGVDTLSIDGKTDMETAPGTTRYFVLEKSTFMREKRGLEEEEEDGGGLEGDEDDEQEQGVDKRQARRTRVYISVNTCRQPLPETPIAIEDPPQLTLYVSKPGSKNQKPGPDSMDDLVGDPITFKWGAAHFNLTTDSDVFIGVHAPKLTAGWKGTFGFEVATSTQQYYHSYNDSSPFLWMIDTDSESALMTTHSITTNTTTTNAIDKWLGVKEIPFTMYAFPKNAWGARGLNHSFCGIREAYGVDTTKIKVDRKMTTQYGTDKLPKTQFHVQGLTQGLEYTGFLVMDGNVATDGLDLSNNLAIGPGGRVWKQVNWTTKSDDSCQVIFGLPFCSEIAYAVPSSPDFKLNTSGLATLYDDQARSYYKNFSNSLDQIACNTTGTAQYSLARNCTHCAEDYKRWMCSVLMPRCEDFSSTSDFLQERNINTPFVNGSVPYSGNNTKEFNETRRFRLAWNSSRNPMIDREIKPGPYKELLPCEDLCFDIVRSCPAQLGFVCPEGPQRDTQYGKRGTEKNPLKCNFPGAVVDLNPVRNGADGVMARTGLAVFVALVVGMSVWV